MFYCSRLLSAVSERTTHRLLANMILKPRIHDVYQHFCIGRCNTTSQSVIIISPYESNRPTHL